MTKPTGDWRDNIITALPEDRIGAKFETFPSALELIEIAAFNRRIRTPDFVGRAALAFAVYDSDGELTWRQAADKEPPMADLRLKTMPRRRLRGRNFGPWVIEGLSE